MLKVASRGGARANVLEQVEPDSSMIAHARCKGSLSKDGSDAGRKAAHLAEQQDLAPPLQPVSAHAMRQHDGCTAGIEPAVA